jgi:neutrophil factor 2
MTTKQDVEKWREGCDLAENGDFEAAEAVFLDMSDITARIYFNLASCATKQGKMYHVGKYIDEAVKKDPYMAVGFYQRGCYFLHQKKYNEAVESFESALKQLRGNLVIDYKQLGLIYKLYSVEVLLNLSYALVQMGRRDAGLKRLEEAYEGSLNTGEQRHQMVSTAYEAAKSGGSFKPFKLPSSAMFYKPPRTKVDNLQKKNFLGVAKVVASITDNDEYTGFLGAQNLPRSRSPSPTRKTSQPSTPGTNGKKFSVPKPSGPLPVPPKDKKSPTNSFSSKPLLPVPPKPSLKPPSVRSTGTSSPSISPEEEEEIFVKVHYTSTRALVVDRRITLKDLEETVCKKFERPIGTVSLW